ncbi:MAG: S8 family peptidase [Myxococcales bacterium]|nr:S8 family peptidase [Myxococcales bacterium]
MKLKRALVSPWAGLSTVLLLTQGAFADSLLPKPTQLLVDLRDETTEADEFELEELLGGIDLRLNSPHAADDRIFVADVSPDTMQALVNLLREDPRVEFAEPNYIYGLLPEEAGTQLLFNEDTDLYHPQRGPLPNDPLWTRQWSFRLIGAQEAWGLADGSGVTVAVIDTGVAYESYRKFRKVEDLEASRFVAGYNFLNDTPHANDDHGHGTHVAGTIAQTTFNARGVAGLAYKAKIMPLKVLSKRGFGTAGDIADAIRFAADEGAQVMNLSLGGGPRSAVMASAVAYARKKGVLVICAAGNAGRPRVEYPAAYAGAFAVSSVGPTKNLAPYSSYGREIAVAGPGGDKLLGGDNGGILQNTIVGNQPDRTDIYLSYQGTSMATPHVAGVAALVISAGVKDAAQVEEIIKSTAEDLGMSGRDDRYGHGLVNAAAAVRAARAAADQNTIPPLHFGGTALLSWLALVVATMLRIGKYALPTLVQPSLLVTLIVTGSGLPLIWLGVHALWTSAFPLLVLTLITLGIRKLRPALVGACLGWATYLLVLSFIGKVDILGIPGVAGWADKLWLIGHAATLFVIAVQTTKVAYRTRTKYSKDHLN